MIRREAASLVRAAILPWCVVVAAGIGAGAAGGPAQGAAGDAARGKAAYEKCAACHALEEGKSSDLGPTLAGLFGRRAGALDDYRYSPAMRRSDVVWDVKTLDAFLADPQAVVRNNRMPFEGIKEEAERADLIAYLQQATAPKPR